jgi:hypothetical protein
MGDTSKVHPSGTMAKDGGAVTEMPVKEKDEKLESDFGQDEKKEDEEKKEPAEMVPYSELVRKKNLSYEKYQILEILKL